MQLQFHALPDTGHPLVSLRPIEAGDLEGWYAYLSMPEVYEHTSWQVASVSELLPFVQLPQAEVPAAQARFAIALRASGRLVGTAGFHTLSTQHRTAELAYDLSPSHWGQGIATLVARSLVSWGHEQLGLIRIQATVLESNARSDQVLRRCGFEHEGLLRSYRLVRGVPGNFHLYAHVRP